jgi:hypothetical protein
MKKIAIPTILTATVLLAGMFAFMPVEKATTVHTTISANQAKVFESDPGIAAGTLVDLESTLDCDADYSVVGIAIDTLGAVDAADDSVDITIGGDDVITALGIEGPGGQIILEAAQSADAGEDTVVIFNGDDDADEDLTKIRFSVITSGDCDITHT